MFAKIKNVLQFDGYKYIAITGFYRKENSQLIYGDREYVLNLADGSKVNQILKEEDWKILEKDVLQIY
ncbi:MULTISPECIES: hypothetical protein [Rahnella]|uniref:Uncharacterized protein n=1 Tax=Rahnella laticis TaxID=2787622 RepID=A0ABS0EAL6_9GAMM|nr:MULTISPECIES: hypothetical protein [Rahnella]MBF7982120.1 hypothetical protein [Rahnella laticis]MBF8002210.1 hypothetical protein [Rahnella sp. LAC-M12]